MDSKTVDGWAKLVDVVASGIGSIAGPLLAPWRAKRESEAKLIAAEGAAKALHLQAEAQASARQLLVRDDTVVTAEIELAESVRQRIEYQEQKRQANITTVVGMAAQELESSVVPDVEADHDWVARFFGDVQDVSSEQMQVLWSRVLAGEIRRPGTTSMRTIGVLRNIDANTARLFSRFCSAAIYLMMRESTVLDARVPSLGGKAAQNSLGDFGFHFGMLNGLNEHGLIIGDYDSYYPYVVVNDDNGATGVALQHQGVLWDWSIAQDNVKAKEVRIHGVAMTVSGCELSRVVSQEPITEYTDALKRFLLKSHGLKMRKIGAAD